MTRTHGPAVSTSATIDPDQPWVWVGRNELVYVGPALGVRPHSTAVPRLLLTLDEPFVLDWGEHQESYQAAYILPRRRHRIVTPGVRWAVAYLEPGGHRDRRCRRSIPDPERLQAHARAGDPHALLTALGPAGREGTRLAPVLDAILDDPAQAPSAESAAASTGLSTSQFLREFSAVTGTTYRRFVLWSRLLQATRLAARYSLTDAAVGAGFASPSHFSDTARTIFGFTASELLATGLTVTTD